MEEERDALDILNEDCWRLVLHEVDSRDKKSCSQTCFLFQQILSREEVTWKFRQIFPFISKHFKKWGRNSDGSWRRKWTPIFDWRLVCNEWCGAVDRYLESYLDNEDCMAGNGDPVDYQLHTTTRIEQFLDTFRDHSGNPFLGRKVMFSCYPMQQEYWMDPAEDNRYTLKLHELLERFGSQIWTAIFCMDRGVGPLQSYRNHQTLLHYLPNLRCLDIREQREIYQYYVAGELGELTAFRTENPLPPLPHLKRLYCGEKQKEMTMAALESYSSQLQQIQIEFLQEVFTALTMSRFTSLNTLYVRDMEDNNTLEVLRGLQSPLESLQCQFNDFSRFSRESDLWSMDLFLENVRHLPITQLTVDQSEAFIGLSGQGQPTIRHEGIRRLSITCFSGKLSFSADVLLLLPNVEVVDCYFHIQYGTRTEVSQHPLGLPGTIQLWDLLLRGDVYHSNVWELVPSLKTLQVKLSGGENSSNTYSRGEYEHQSAE